jgi:hypothetical protein
VAAGGNCLVTGWQLGPVAWRRAAGPHERSWADQRRFVVDQKRVFVDPRRFCTDQKRFCADPERSSVDPERFVAPWRRRLGARQRAIAAQVTRLRPSVHVVTSAVTWTTPPRSTSRASEQGPSSSMTTIPGPTSIAGRKPVACEPGTSLPTRTCEPRDATEVGSAGSTVFVTDPKRAV